MPAALQQSAVQGMPTIFLCDRDVVPHAWPSMFVACFDSGRDGIRLWAHQTVKTGRARAGPLSK
eukprot:353090-Chlamydomonas_euryale.AAC.14